MGLGIEFGGTRDGHRSDPTLEERMTDPVERYLAALSKNQAIPDRISQVFNSEVITETNIAFFSQTGGPNNGGIGLTLANCTFENPCGPSDLTDASAITLGESAIIKSHPITNFQLKFFYKAMTIRLFVISFIIMLMVIFSRPECCCRCNFGNYLITLFF